MIEIKELYSVVWRLNDVNYTRVCDTLSEAIEIRERLLRTKYESEDVSIHLIQVNKFGDKIIVECSGEDK